MKNFGVNMKMTPVSQPGNRNKEKYQVTIVRGSGLSLR